MRSVVTRDNAHQNYKHSKVCYRYVLFAEWKTHTKIIHETQDKQLKEVCIPKLWKENCTVNNIGGDNDVT